jgi:hypothetical protein
VERSGGNCLKMVCARLSEIVPTMVIKWPTTSV